jgi:hypothetical protein
MYVQYVCIYNIHIYTYMSYIAYAISHAISHAQLVYIYIIYIYVIYMYIYNIYITDSYAMYP